MVLTGDSASVSLTARLRQDTKIAHVTAERSGVMKAVLRGQVTRRAYCELLRALYTIYAALETSLERRSSLPFIAAIRHSGLARRAALADDLESLHGPTWAAEVRRSPIADAYAARLARLADDEPIRLIAHAYVRYLGDLNGGQLLRHLVADALGSSGGLTFYDFGTPDEVASLRDRFRAALDQLPLDDAMMAAIVDEAQRAFADHTRLFCELEETTRSEPTTPALVARAPDSE